MEKILKILKERWNLESPRRIALVLFVFSISGLSVLYVREVSFHWLGFTSQTPLWEEAAAWILIVVPVYQLLLLIYGSILGQFDFFWHFEKNHFKRLKRLFSKINSFL